MRQVDEKTVPRATLPRQLDATLLELFDCVRQTQNLSAAGAQLGMSQPAVSRGLARLRELYGDPLFVRRPRGVEPTPHAEALAPVISAALETLRATFKRPHFEPATETRTFRVAMSDIGERLFLPRLLQDLTERAPRVTLEAISPSLDDLQDGLARGHIDLAVGYLGGLSKQVHQRRLFKERFVYVARPDHPALARPLRREQLRDLPHVVAGPAGMQHAAAVDKVLGSPRVRARVALRVHSFLCVGPVVANTDLVGVIPANLAAVVAGHVPLQWFDPPVALPGFDVTLAWHQRFHREPGNLWLRERFVVLFDGLRVG